MGDHAHLQPVPDDGLPEYPFGRDDRLETHYFLTFHVDRWLNSELRLTIDWQYRGLALDLFYLAQKQSPVGTLPRDDRQIAKLLHMDHLEWMVVLQAERSPLYKWTECLCEGEIRLMHPVVLEMVQDAFQHREKNKRNQLDRAQAGRLKTIEAHLEKMGVAGIARDPITLEWLDEWLVENKPEGRRTTQAWTARALQAHSEFMNKGGKSKSL